MKYTIVESKDKLVDGLVPHAVLVDGKVIAGNISYDKARELVESGLSKGDTITEDYKSSGRKVHLTFDQFMAEQENTRNWLAK